MTPMNGTGANLTTVITDMMMPAVHAHLAKDIGRVLYCCNIMFWYMRILHLMTVSSILGPYITMYGKMVSFFEYVSF